MYRLCDWQGDKIVEVLLAGAPVGEVAVEEGCELGGMVGYLEVGEFVDHYVFNASHRHAGQQSAHLGRGEELPLVLAALAGKVMHQILVGIADKVVGGGTIARKVETLALERCNEFGDNIACLLGRTETLVAEIMLVNIDEIEHTVVGILQSADNLIDAVTDIKRIFEVDNILERAPLGNLDKLQLARPLTVGDILQEEHDKHIILKQLDVQPAITAKLVRTLSQRTIQFRLLYCHDFL